MKIEVVGNNAITSNEACISISKKSTISGSGTLRLKTPYDCGLFMYKSSLTVEGVKLYTEGRFGVAGVDGKSAETLTLRNAYVEATGSLGSVCYLQDLILDGCSITQPTGAEFDSHYHSVLLNGKKVTDKVVIEPDANGISDITTDVPAHAKGIYSLTGVKQTQQWNELPAGIYIVDGVKRVKR